MLSLIKKRKTHSAGKEHDAQQKLADNIVSACIHLQQRWAVFMGRQTEHLSHQGKLTLFFSFCLIAGSLSSYFIVNSMTGSKASSFTIMHQTKSRYTVKSGDEATKTLEIVSKKEYEKMQRFRYFMDSLARSPSGKRLYDSIRINRPGLRDSILLIERIYQLQNIK